MGRDFVLVLGGASGCVSNIVVDGLCDQDKYDVVCAGRTPMKARGDKTVTFLPFDIFEKGGTNRLIAAAKKQGSCKAVVNCISTGGKVSYDTTKIAYLNYCAVNAFIHIAKELKATLLHMSSFKVGLPERFNADICEGMEPWNGARSPYAWSKLAAELKLSNSDLEDMSYIRIGLMDSPHAKRFYTRVRATCDFPVKVTDEIDLKDAIFDAVEAKGRHLISVKTHAEQCPAFYKRMSGRTCIAVFPRWLFDYTFGKLLPTKMIDYCDSSGDFTYALPL